jgi:hypothetical protein
MLDDVSELMHLAALHERRLAEEIPNRAPKRLRAVDHPQAQPRGIEPPLHEIGQQCLYYGGVLGGAFTKPEDVLSSLGIDAQGD